MNNRERLRRLYTTYRHGARALDELYPVAIRALERLLDKRFATRRGGLGLTEIATDAVQVALHETHRIPDWDHFLSFARTAAVRLVLQRELKRGRRRSLAEAIGIPAPRSGETDGELEEAVVAASLGMDIENVAILCGMIRGEPSLAEQAAELNMSLATLKRRRHDVREHIRRALGLGD